MRALVILLALGGVAYAEDPADPMTRLAEPLPDRPTEVRFVPGVGQLWRYGTRIVLFDGAWWSTWASLDRTAGMGGKTTEVGDEQARLDVVPHGETLAVAVTVTGRRRICGESTCGSWEHVTERLVCWRDRDRRTAPKCWLE